jgi:uncharacterized coiled-coil DUF342 family protein
MNEATTHFICTTCGKEWDRPHDATICPGCRGALAPAAPVGARSGAGARSVAHGPESHSASDGTFRRVSGVIGIIIGTITAVTILNESYINYVRFGQEINSLKQQVAELHEKLNAKPAAPDELQKELTAQKEMASGLNRQLMQATQQAESSRFASDQAKSQLAIAQANADVAQRENSKLSRQLDDRQADIKDLNQKIDTLNVKLATSTGPEDKGAKAELQNKITKLTQDLATATTQAKTLEQSMTAATGQVARLTQDLDSAKAKANRSEQEAIASTAKVESLNTKLQSAQADVQRLTGAVELANGKMEQMKGEQATMAQQVTKLTASRDEAFAQLDKIMHPPSVPHVGTMTAVKWKTLIDKMKLMRKPTDRITSMEVLNTLGPCDEKTEARWIYYDANGKEYTVTFDINAKPMKGINPPM